VSKIDCVEEMCDDPSEDCIEIAEMELCTAVCDVVQCTATLKDDVEPLENANRRVEALARSLQYMRAMLYSLRSTGFGLETFHIVLRASHIDVPSMRVLIGLSQTEEIACMQYVS